ncbi:MAG: hypothetical protein KatS3mg009_2162 [Acidimicrobiia bacterium]|nr:MAG: hypothetical protein KatS3mg009_2162 [Acidimicrobiia bacterium]
MRDNRPMPGGAAAVSRRDDASSRRAAGTTGRRARRRGGHAPRRHRRRARTGPRAVRRRRPLARRGGGVDPRAGRRSPGATRSRGRRTANRGASTATAFDLGRRAGSTVLGGRAAVAAVMRGRAASRSPPPATGRRAEPVPGPGRPTGGRSVATAVASPFVVERPQSVSFVCFAVAVGAAEGRPRRSRRWLVARSGAPRGRLVEPPPDASLAGVARGRARRGGVAVLERRRVRPPGRGRGGRRARRAARTPTGSAPTRPRSTVRVGFEGGGDPRVAARSTRRAPCSSRSLVAAGASRCSRSSRTGRWSAARASCSPLAVVGAMALDARRNLPLLRGAARPRSSRSRVPPAARPRARPARVASRRGPARRGAPRRPGRAGRRAGGALRDLRPVTSALGAGPVGGGGPCRVPRPQRLRRGRVDRLRARPRGARVDGPAQRPVRRRARIREQSGGPRTPRGAWRRVARPPRRRTASLARTDAPLVGALRAAGLAGRRRATRGTSLLVRP